MQRTRISRTWLTASGAVLSGVLLLAACGGGGSSSSAAAASSGNGANTANSTNGQGGPGGRLSAFRDCMAKQGITLPQRNRGQNGGTPGSTSASGSTPRYSIAPGGPADGGPGDGNGDGGPPGGGFGGGFGGGGIANRIPAGVDPTKWQNALKACQSSLPTGGNFNSSAFQAYRSCLSDHGVTLPAQGSTTPATINRNDPKIQAALKTCAPLRPQGFGRSTTTTTPTKA